MDFTEEIIRDHASAAKILADLSPLEFADENTASKFLAGVREGLQEVPTARTDPIDFGTVKQFTTVELVTLSKFAVQVDASDGGKIFILPHEGGLWRIIKRDV